MPAILTTILTILLKHIVIAIADLIETVSILTRVLLWGARIHILRNYFVVPALYRTSYDNYINRLFC